MSLSLGGSSPGDIVFHYQPGRRTGSRPGRAPRARVTESPTIWRPHRSATRHQIPLADAVPTDRAGGWTWTARSRSPSHSPAPSSPDGRKRSAPYCASSKTGRSLSAVQQHHHPAHREPRAPCAHRNYTGAGRPQATRNASPAGKASEKPHLPVNGHSQGRLNVTLLFILYSSATSA